MLLRRIDHIGYAVEDLDTAIEHHERLYGATVTHRETVESDGVAEALLAVGESYIQLLQPISDDSPVATFIARNGQGVHHVAYGVADVDAALEQLQAEGAQLIDQHGRRGSRGTTVAFLHPKGSLGVLIELVEDSSV